MSRPTPNGTPKSSPHRRPSSTALVRQVARREVTTKLHDRTYLISIGAFLAIIVAVIAFNVLSASGASNHTVAVVGPADSQLKQAAKAQADQMGATIEFVEVDDRADGADLLAGGEVDIVLDGDTLLRTNSLPSSLSAIMQNAHQSVAAIQRAEAAGIDPAQLAEVMQVQPLHEQPLDPSSGDGLENGIVAIVAVGMSYGMLIMIIQFVAQGVVEEKSSRVVELLMTAVRPRQLLAGKVLGLGILGFIQMLLILGLGLMAALAFDLVDIPASGWSTIVQVLAWYVLGYAFFAVLAAAAASLVSRQEDLGAALMPPMIVPLLAFFLAFQVLNSPDGTLATVASLLPGLSPTTMPVRAAVSSVPIWQYVVAIGLQIIAIYLLVRLAARIYSGAMLKTSGKLKVAEAMRRASDAPERSPSK